MLDFSEPWRAEAYCSHHGWEHITKIRDSTPLSRVYQAYTASVVLQCGERASIVTTAKNLHLIGVFNDR